MDLPIEITDFIEDMNRLAKKHKLTVSACSCCDGVHLDELKNPKGSYTVTKDSHNGEWIWFGWDDTQE